MQRLEVSGAVRLIYRSLGVKVLNKLYIFSAEFKLGKLVTAVLLVI